VTDRAVRLVLDTTAVLEFARGSVHVGEVLAEFADGKSGAAVPLACLAEAYPTAVEPDRLRALVAHEAVSVMTDDAAEWESLGHLCALVGGFAQASAALAALDFDCWVLTARPELYDAVKGGDLVVAIED
jgi:hypothetical protein